MVAMLVNTQWPTGAANSTRLRHPAFEALVVLTNRIVWFPGDDGRPAASPQENHCWLVWDWSRTPGPARLMFAGKDADFEPEARCCIVCRTPLPPTARADARLCSATCRQRASAPRHGQAPHCLTIQVPVNDPLNMRLCLDSSVLLVPTFVIG